MGRPFPQRIILKITLESYNDLCVLQLKSCWFLKRMQSMPKSSKRPRRRYRPLAPRVVPQIVHSRSGLGKPLFSDLSGI